MSWTWRRAHGARVVAKGVRALVDTQHPILVHLVPMRRCNLACAYCNEYDAVSQPVPLEIMLRRVDKLADLGTSMITVSGGEPLMHPELDAMIARMRRARHDLLPHHQRLLPLARAHPAPQRRRPRLPADQHRQRGAGRGLAEEPPPAGAEAEVAGRARASSGSTSTRWWAAGIKNPEDALAVARRARELGFTSTVGILHDGRGPARAAGRARAGRLPGAQGLRQPRRRALQRRLPGQPGPGPAQRLELPGRRALPLRGRARPRALLLADARRAGQCPWRATGPRTSPASTSPRRRARRTARSTACSAWASSTTGARPRHRRPADGRPGSPRGRRGRGRGGDGPSRPRDLRAARHRRLQRHRRGLRPRPARAAATRSSWWRAARDRLARLAAGARRRRRRRCPSPSTWRSRTPRERCRPTLAARGHRLSTCSSTTPASATPAASTSSRRTAMRAMIDLDVRAVRRPHARASCRPWSRAARGAVINVVSMSAFQPVPFLAVYAASKAFVLSLTKSLATELEGTGVVVQALCPGQHPDRVPAGGGHRRRALQSDAGHERRRRWWRPRSAASSAGA